MDSQILISNKKLHVSDEKSTGGRGRLTETKIENVQRFMGKPSDTVQSWRFTKYTKCRMGYLI